MGGHQILVDIDEWQDYKLAMEKAKDDEGFNPTDRAKTEEQFRNYQDNARKERVTAFYTMQHQLQSYDTVLEFENRHLEKFRNPEVPGLEMGVWEALEYLNQVVDDSDPDTNLTQMEHALQTAEAVRRDWPGEEYDWFHLTGLIHDLGKLLAVDDEEKGLVGDPQWAVVGDTFPVGCPFSDTNVFHEAFKLNPDYHDSRFNTGTGVYQKGCGLFNVHMSWGHDEYLFRVLEASGTTLPLSALYMIRFHSFYPWHKEGGYEYLLNQQDRDNLKWVKEFNKYDLYSKSDEKPDTQALMEYYKGLIAKYFPKKLKW